MANRRMPIPERGLGWSKRANQILETLTCLREHNIVPQPSHTALGYLGQSWVDIFVCAISDSICRQVFRRTRDTSRTAAEDRRPAPVPAKAHRHPWWTVTARQWARQC